GAFSGELCFYVISGANNAEILQRYHQLTGTQPLPPRWALGNFMSRFGYVSEQQTRDIAQKMTNAHIPFDAIIHDLFWFGDSIKNTLGNLEWVNKKAWPNPAKMIADFNSQNRKTVLITEPFVLEPTLNYASGKQFLAVDSLNNLYTLTKFYFGRGGIIDLFRKDAQQWFWQYYQKQMNNGVEGWWGDLGEPENHPTDVYHNLSDKGFKRLFSADEVHNAFGHNWTKMLYEQFAKNYPNKRLFSLNRSGFAGTQRYSIFPWSGDVSRNWSGYAAQLPVMLGMSMSGVPYIHADAGGFAGGEGSNELYLRWLQFAAYTPIFRPHGTALYEKDPNAYSFPSEPALFGEPTLSIARNIVQQRYAMLPYNYTLAYEQAVNGSPLARPLYYAFPNDADACKVEDSYMWGDNLLIAPVLKSNQQARSIYLPKGTTWYVNNTNKQYEGGQTVNLPTPLSFMPILVKAGAFIPQYP
ncbi:MAG: TIM-barrel domain-containing protein, partial [Chitinophagaceae bacterium]